LNGLLYGIEKMNPQYSPKTWSDS